MTLVSRNEVSEEHLQSGPLFIPCHSCVPLTPLLDMHAVGVRSFISFWVTTLLWVNWEKAKWSIVVVSGSRLSIQYGCPNPGVVCLHSSASNKVSYRAHLCIAGVKRPSGRTFCRAATRHQWYHSGFPSMDDCLSIQFGRPIEFHSPLVVRSSAFANGLRHSPPPPWNSSKG